MKYAPLSPHLTEEVPATAEPTQTPRAEGYKDMDTSQALREDGVVMAGQLHPESTNYLPESTAFVFAREAGRWKECMWDPAFDRPVFDFEKVSK
jgi:hypothetical protein